MSTLAQFRTEISNVLGLTTGAGDDQDFIDARVNEGVAKVLTRTSCKVLPATMTLTAASANYTLSTSILSVIDVYLVGAATSEASQLARVTPAEMLGLRARNPIADSPVRRYAVDGGNLLMIYPTPTAADVIHLLYVPRPTTLASGTDTPSEVPAEWHDLVSYYALFRCADYDDDASSQMGDRYRALYEQGLLDMKKALNRFGGHRLAPAVVNRRRRVLVPHDPSADW